MPHCVTKASKQLLKWESLWKMKPKSIHVRHLRIQLIVWNEIWFLRHSPDLQFSVLTFSSLLFTYATICILIYLKQMPHCVSNEWKQMLNWESLWKMKPKSIHVRHLIDRMKWNLIFASFTRSSGLGLGLGLGLVGDLDVMSFVSQQMFLDYSV